MSQKIYLLEEEKEPYVVKVEDISLLEELAAPETTAPKKLGIVPKIEVVERFSRDIFALQTAKIEIVLALPSEKTPVQLFLLEQEREPSPLFKPLCSQIQDGVSYNLRILLSDDWYTLTEKISQQQPLQRPHAILFPYSSKRNVDYLSTMYRPKRYFSEEGMQFKSAFDVCALIASRKKNQDPEEYPWLYVFGEESIPESAVWNIGVKKYFPTLDITILAQRFRAEADIIFQRERRKALREGLNLYQKR